jgi:hypothetical protein
MCNAGCDVTFTKIGFTIVYRGRTIVCGRKCIRTGLWMIPLQDITTSPPTLPITVAAPIALATHVDATSLAAEYARYIHQSLCSPPAATLLHALGKSTELQTIPGLTTALIRAHLPRSTATDKGHMHPQRSNTASTQTNHTDIIRACHEVDLMAPLHEACAMHDVLCFATLADANTGTMYTNLYGAFLVHLFKNMQYVFVAYV